MTAFRLIPLQAHGALEMLVGILTMVAPFALGFDPAGTVLAVVVGAALVGLALGSTTDERGVPAVPVATHHAADYGLAIGVGGAALVLGVAGDAVAGFTLAGIAALQLALNLSTRYSARA
ncbi:hypothetical protein GKE82_01465 [Conexibacter sp. W3-3-2]|uniref:SPW repeat protein n=1 Tax=Conexibacter sp. W3-3-2 TaxID=2675227 RepID=UPI0012B757D1|nr:SPW repeat protein [Conexibacter sp. W3-3-2]MTD43007.1 hypothetical protein [Conexibacter sp. W3-3-2]